MGTNRLRQLFDENEQEVSGSYVGDANPSLDVQVGFIPDRIEIYIDTAYPSGKHWEKSSSTPGADAFRSDPAAQGIVTPAIEFIDEKFRVYTGQCNSPGVTFRYTVWGKIQRT